MSTVGNPEAKLLRLEAAFNAKLDGVDRVGAKLDELEAALDRVSKRIRKAERKQDRKAEDSSRLFSKIMKTRAKSLEGLVAKVRVRERWNTDDEASEITILKSLVADINAIAGAE